MIPDDMPAEFAAVIREHGGEWMEWTKRPHHPEWLANDGEDLAVIQPGPPARYFRLVPRRESLRYEPALKSLVDVVEPTPAGKRTGMAFDEKSKTVLITEEVEVAYAPDRPEEFVRGTFEKPRGVERLDPAKGPLASYVRKAVEKAAEEVPGILQRALEESLKPPVTLSEKAYLTADLEGAE